MSNRFQTDEYRHFEDLSLEEAKHFGTYQPLPITEIIEDPDNRDVFGEYDTDGLAMSIRENGFHGAILVYPFEGSFRLQSGHRSLEAARKAGLTQIPAIITEPPESEVDRRRNLIIPNTHERNKKPMLMARMVDYHYRTLLMERDEMSAAGHPIRSNITEKVAEDLEISSSQVVKYRSLLNLIPRLQEAIEKMQLPWSALAGAATLPPQTQEMLFMRISGRYKMYGSDGLTREWLNTEIKEFKLIKPVESTSYQYDRNDMSLYSEKLQKKIKEKPAKKEKPGKRLRRIDVVKALHQSEHYLEKSLRSDTFIKDDQEAMKTLMHIRQMVSELMELF